MATDGTGATVAHDGEVAVALDEAQYRDDDGPCLRSYREGHVVRLDRIETETERWRAFVEAAAEHGIHSSLSLPLQVDGEAIGALNLYASSPAAFTDDAAEVAGLFGAQAAIALSNAAVYWKARDLSENLRAALENRDIIGQAKGVLMARRGLTADEAFTLLRHASQEQNVKLRSIAEQVAWTGVLTD